MQMSLRLINRFYYVGGTSQMPYHLTAAVRRQDVIYNTMMFPLQLMLCLGVWMLHILLHQIWKMWYFPSTIKRACVCSIISSKALSRLFSLNHITDRGFSLDLAYYCVTCSCRGIFFKRPSDPCVNGLIAPYLCLYRRSSNFPAGCCFIWMTSDGCLTG